MAKDVCKLAVEKYGLTDDIVEAGYIMPDGKMLDFSGGHDGHRTLEHRDILFLMKPKKYGRYENDMDFDAMDTDDAWQSIRDFQSKCKAIRIAGGRHPHGHEVDFDILTKPTTQQLKVMEDIIDFSKYTILERTNLEGKSVCHVSEFNPSNDIVGSFMKQCFK